MEEPLRHFYSESGFDRESVSLWSAGERYFGLINSDGNLGVCATLGHRVKGTLLEKGEPDLNDFEHRVILTAWFNSVYNYRREYTDISDIFDRIDFKKEERIVMIGYFESLYSKFTEKGISTDVFDMHKESPVLQDLSIMNRKISEAGSIILTGTSILNNTFMNIISQTADGCNIYLLGPSNIIDEDMFRFRNLKVVFGSVFAKNDRRVLDKISLNHGTRGFLPYLNKVFLVSPEYRI